MNLPDGWKLVPIVVTREMIAAHWGKAGLRIQPKIAAQWTDHAVELQGTPNEPGFLKAWRAMLDAAPEPPIVEQTHCPCCRRSREDFQTTTTCGMGGCPWGGDI